ncbi:MAG TPA: right-handed parallel beta-helix repeat-containing protein, partial [Prosthecobacter sp.]|nr:right-handed parallel beta-helix repeat-containing protein [Prosthecobacter sp.]
APRSLILTSPDGGQFLGSPVGIAWNLGSAGWQPDDSLLLEYSPNGGSTWLPIAGGSSVPVSWTRFWWDTVGLPNGLGYLVRATCVQDPSVQDVSNGWFALAKPGDGHWDLYVAPDGVDDAYHGTASRPLRTINAALEIAQAGVATAMVNIRVAAGTYPERVSMRPYVNLLGGYSAADWSRDISMHVTTLNGLGGSVVTGADNALLEGFTITGGSAANGGGIYCNAVSPTIRFCRIVNNTATNGAGVYVTGAAPQLISCRILSNSSSYGGGVYLTGASPQMISCVVANNQAAFGDGMYVQAGSPMVINCTLAGNGGFGIGAYTSGTCSVTNSILWNNGDDIVTGSGAEVVTNYCDVEDNDAGTGNLHSNPLLDANFRLMAGSPCRNAGSGSVLQPAWVDVDGNPRVYASAVDLGAHEQQSPLVMLQVTDAVAEEHDRSQAVFLLTRDGDTSAELVVRCAISGSAATGDDYTGISAAGLVTFPVGAAAVSLSVTPVADALVEGTETVTLTLLADPAYLLAGTAAGTVDIRDIPAIPVITSSVSVAATLGQFVSYQISATDFPSSYGAENLPPGLELNSSTGVISGTPSLLETGSFVVHASNVTGTGSAAVSWSVNPKLAAAPTELPGCMVTHLVEWDITVSGGTKPYTTFAVTNLVSGGTTISNSSFSL